MTAKPKQLSQAFDSLKIAMGEAEQALNATSDLLEKRMDKIAAQREEAQREAAALGQDRAKIQAALGNGANEDLWQPGTSWVDAAIRAIQHYENHLQC